MELYKKILIFIIFIISYNYLFNSEKQINNHKSDKRVTFADEYNKPIKTIIKII